jgi:hypothetical protein
LTCMGFPSGVILTTVLPKGKAPQPDIASSGDQTQPHNFREVARILGPQPRDFREVARILGP